MCLDDLFNFSQNSEKPSINGFLCGAPFLYFLDARKAPMTVAKHIHEFLPGKIGDEE